MLDDEAQTALDEALATGDATYEISKGRHALILTVKNGNRLIPLMDQIFGYADLDLIPNVHRNSDNAVPVLMIGKYVTSPKFERNEVEGYHKYELTYSERGNSSK